MSPLSPLSPSPPSLASLAFIPYAGEYKDAYDSVVDWLVAALAKI